MNSLPSDPLNRANLPEADGLVKPDVESAFLLYACFCGNVVRTAHALAVPEGLVEELAREHKWDSKLQPIIALKQSTRPGDVERAINRALNFVQAHSFRLFLARVCKRLTGLSSTDLEAFLFPQEVKGRPGDQKTYISMTTRTLADLASALEKAQTLTYLALSDTATDRRERQEAGDEGVAAAELHVKLAQLMAQSGGGSLQSKVADARLAIAQEYATIPLNPPVVSELPADE